MTLGYQLKPDPFSSHSLIARQLRQILQRMESEEICTVLDIGCSQGFIGSLLPQERFYFIGVDHDQNALEKLPSVYKTKIQADIETPAVLDSLTLTPDVLILADVLEHTRNPDQVLRQMMTVVKPDGYIIVSLPNVAHLAIRLGLMFGKFEYTDRGILDRTHLRFFTLSSAMRLCSLAGMDICGVLFTPVPLPLIHPWFSPGGFLYFLHRLSAALTQVFKSLLAYQIICIGRKQSN